MSPTFTSSLVLALAALSQAAPHVGFADHFHGHAHRDVQVPAATQAPKLLARDGSCQDAPMAPMAGGAVTLNIVNSMSSAVQVAPSNKGAILEGNPTGGSVAQSTSFVMPQGWSGNVAVGHEVADANSLIEMNVDGGSGLWPDVSYVKGYSVPIVCSCGEGEHIITGSNKDLGTCNNAVNSACPNPVGSMSASAPDSFFSDAQGCAYTFPADNNAMGHCGGNEIWCCVGTSCPSNNRTACLNHMVAPESC